MGYDGLPSGLSASFTNRLERESWALYGLGLFLIGLRIYARVRKMRFRGLEVDDYLVVVALVFYTLLIICINKTAQAPGSALAFPGEDVYALTPTEIDAYKYGAKIDLVAEQGMLNTIWTLKYCMLIFYYRLTQGLRSQVWVKILALYTVLGYVAIQLAWFLQCRPFSSYWQIVPVANRNCEVLYDYAIVQATFNLSSDVAMLFIPLPLVWGVAVPLRQKLVLMIVFSMGLFVIAAALCTKIEFFSDIYSASYLFWYVREASVAVYVVNLPCIWPLLREFIPVLKSWTPGASSKTRSRNGTSTNRVTATFKSTRNHLASRRSMDDMERIAHPVEMESRDGKKGFAEPHILHGNAGSDDDKSSSHSTEQLPGTIRHETTIEIHSESRADADKWV